MAACRECPCTEIVTHDICQALSCLGDTAANHDDFRVRDRCNRCDTGSEIFCEAINDRRSHRITILISVKNSLGSDFRIAQRCRKNRILCEFFLRQADNTCRRRDLLQAAAVSAAAGIRNTVFHVNMANLSAGAVRSFYDLAINNDGWTEDQTADYLAQFGISGSDTVHEVYMQIVGNPGSYLPYVVGYLEFQSLYDNAQDKAGADFDPVAFHKEILTIGPCSFDILEARMLSDGYINSTVNTDDSGSL